MLTSIFFLKKPNNNKLIHNLEMKIRKKSPQKRNLKKLKT